MPCRVGITTDSLACRVDWDGRVVGLRNWLVISTHRSRSAAKRAAIEYARISDGCVISSDVEGLERGDWSVYRFTFDHDRDE